MASPSALAATVIDTEPEPVPVVLTSGYGEETATRRLDPSAFAGFLPKPYSLGELLQAVLAAQPGAAG